MAFCRSDKNEPFYRKNLPELISPHHMGPARLHAPIAAFFQNKPLSACHQNGEVLSTVWEEDVVEQKSTSVLNLKITPADNQAEVCCESFNLVSPSPLSVSGKLTVLCE